MMVLVLGDNSECFLQSVGQHRRVYSLFVNVSHELSGNEMMLLPRLMNFSITNFSSVQEFLIIKNLGLCTNSSSTKLFLT